MQHGYEKFVNNVMDLKTHYKNNYVIDVGKAVVQGGMRPNSVCGLSFSRSHGGPVNI